MGDHKINGCSVVAESYGKTTQSNPAVRRTCWNGTRLGLGSAGGSLLICVRFFFRIIQVDGQLDGSDALINGDKLIVSA